jgi:nitrile hydratase accessory protein
MTEPVFAAPWEARAFALVRTLRDDGVFSHQEWADALGAQLERGDDAGADYYRHWLTALETLLRDKGVATRERLERHRAAWQHATQRTPHGQPILLTAEDFSDRRPEAG